MSLMDLIKEKFGEKVDIFEKPSKRIYLNASRDDAADLARYLHCELGGRFSTASGLDTQNGVEILYHIALDRLGVMASIKVLVEKPELKMQSFTGFMPAAEWVEREIHEMLGVEFAGHPNLEKLLLPDDWPEGEYPYRKKTFGSEKENEQR